MFKYLITGGCSFSQGGGHDNDLTGGLGENWVGYLTYYIKQKTPELKFEHTGYMSQGQDLISKKIMLACMEAMDDGCDPKDICVIPMWSGTTRRAWYITNRDIIKKIIEGYPNYVGGMTPQFLDLKNKFIGDIDYFVTGCEDSRFEYSTDGGWYFTVNGSDTELCFVQDYYNLDGQVNGPHIGVSKVHYSLERIIMLQNFCNLHGIKIIHQFFMDHVWQDIQLYKDHQMIKYLYDQLNFNNIIFDGMFEWLHQFIGIEKNEAMLLSHKDRTLLDNNRLYFDPDGFHPGQLGHRLWTEKILIPFLLKQYEN